MKPAEPDVEVFILDLFGVIIGFDDDLVPARFAKHCADPDDALRRLDRIMVRHDIITGASTLEQVHRELIDEHGLTMDYQAFQAAWLEPYSWPMPGMADLLKALSKHYRLLLLSNVDTYYFQVVKAMQPELGCFQELLVSCDLGLAKPDPEIFLHAARTAGADPTRCWFVDDTQANIDAAGALGFQTHWLRDVSGFEQELRQAKINGL